MKTIRIITEVSSAKSLQNMLESTIPASDISFPTPEKKTVWRGAEQAVLITVVGAISTTLGAILSGLFNVAREKNAKSIILVGKDGTRVEAPATYTAEEISKLVDVCNKLGVERIEVKRDNLS